MKKDGIQSHLTPKEAAKAKEDTPQPLLNAQPRAAKWFPTKLHNKDLHEKKRLSITMNLRRHHDRRLSNASPGSTFSRLSSSHLYDQSPQHNGAEDGIVEDALKDVSLAVDFPGVQLIKDLHEDEGVEDDGVVLRRWAVEGAVPPAVDVKHLLTCEWKGQTLLSGWLLQFNHFHFIRWSID